MKRTAPAIALLLLAAAARVSGGDEPPVDPRVEQLLAGLFEAAAPGRDWEAISKATRRPARSRAEDAMAWFDENPDRVGDYISRIPVTESSLSRIAALYEAQRARPTWPADRIERVHRWLMAHADAYRSELLAQASEGVGVDRDGAIEGEETLEILAAKDWPAASELYVRLSTDAHASVRAYALSMLYRKAAGDSRRELLGKLEATAQSDAGTSFARLTAFDALTSAAWEGDVDWYLSLFHDPAWMRLAVGNVIHRPLARLVARNPDAWIPRVAPLLASRDRPTRDNAVTCLVQFHLERARTDALRPLLPWVADPAWSSADDRLRLLQSLEKFTAADDAPVVAAALETAADKWELQAIAEQLTRRPCVDAIPALRDALRVAADARARKGGDDRLDDGAEAALVRALVAAGGMDVAEQAGSVEAYVRASRHATTPDAVIGSTLAVSAPDDVLARLVARARELESHEPAVAKALLALVDGAESEVSDARLLGRLEEGTIDVEGVESLLARREALREVQGPALARLARAPGFVGGVAMVLLGDASLAQAALKEAASVRCRALLACARLVRAPLPLDAVVALLEAKDPALATAADRFLEAEDSPKARAALWARAPGAARILGAGGGGEVETREKALRAEVSSDAGPDEIWALFSYGTWGGDVIWIVRRKSREFRVARDPNRADGSRGALEEWPLVQGSALALIDALAKDGVDELPACTPSVCDGVQYVYVHVARAGGVRVFMNNPGPFDPDEERWTDAYSRLVAAFHDLRKTRPVGMAPAKDSGGAGGGDGGDGR